MIKAFILGDSLAFSRIHKGQLIENSWPYIVSKKINFINAWNRARGGWTSKVACSRVSRELELDPVDGEYKPGLIRMAEAAVAAVRGENHCLPSIEASLRSMELVAAFYGKTV